MPHSVQRMCAWTRDVHRREDGKWHRDEVRARVASFS